MPVPSNPGLRASSSPGRPDGRPPRRPAPTLPPYADDRVAEEEATDWSYDPSKPPAPGRRGKPNRLDHRLVGAHAF